MQRKLTPLMVAACGLALGSFAVQAAAPAKPDGYVTYKTYPGDQRAAIDGGTAVPDGVFYPKRAEGPYNGYPGPDSGDDDTKPAGDVRNSYTMHLQFYFYPPRNGKIQFAIASDDPGTLFFSTDDNPANKQVIATEPQWNPVRAFGGEDRRTRTSAGGPPADRLVNQSSFIDVVAGKAYYMEAHASEGGGGDNLAVAFRYDSDPEFANDDKPIDGDFTSAFGLPTAVEIVAQPRDQYVYAGSPTTFSVGINAPPTIPVTSIKWQKNGVDIPDSNSATLTISPAAADDGAKIKAVIAYQGGSITSAEATLNVAALANEFAAGVMKWDVYRGAAGGIDGLTSDPKYPNSPDEVRLLTAYEAPVDIYDNYGARISGFITPQVTGDYVFFISTDDPGAFYLSADENPANKKLVASEPTWNPSRAWVAPDRRDPDNPENRSDKFQGTEWAGGPPAKITLQAGRRYYTELLYVEGGGGDNGAVTMKLAGAPDPAGGSAPTLVGSLIGANVKPNKGDVAITKQPTGVNTQEARTVVLSVDGTVTPAGFNFPLGVKWQKDGADILGAGGKTFQITNAKVADSGKYRAVLSAPSGKTVNSDEVTVTVVPDTFPPKPTVGVLKKGAKFEIGIGFDEAVKPEAVAVQANYSVSPGSIESFRYVPQSGHAVITVAGAAAGSTVTVSVKNVEDLKGNKIPEATPATVQAKLESKLAWVGVGGNEANVLKGNTNFPDDAVALNEKDFDLISGGTAHWGNYDEMTFVYEEVTGDFDRVVRVEYQDPTSQWARAGLQIREALDEGLNPETTSGPGGSFHVDNNPTGTKISQAFTIRVNPTVGATAPDGTVVPGNNAYEIILRPRAGYRYDGFNAIYNVVNGFGGAPPYPNAWMRIQRVGQRINVYKSEDGQNWGNPGYVVFANDPETEEDELWADKLFVGPFYGPELANNNILGGDILTRSSVAKFRDYGPFGTTPPPTGGKITSIAVQGSNIVIAYEGTLQRATSITGPWTDVTGASPLNEALAGAAQFFRIKP